jgi:hypothetical protein
VALIIDPTRLLLDHFFPTLGQGRKLGRWGRGRSLACFLQLLGIDLGEHVAWQLPVGRLLYAVLVVDFARARVSQAVPVGRHQIVIHI